ncbi:hypothetical protein Dda_4478 [Drechslerella dactyloides]|uniref:Uncharacterized protein n=1 Tax=Drechslerella dactyloides TaxID=74499 RepID=A0AAD6IYD0_DREDA|nr:hypothetical protein Dda_4478 [Drechslerella dactyloides]
MSLVMKLHTVARGLAAVFFVVPASSKPLLGLGPLKLGDPPKPLGTANGLSFKGFSLQAAEVNHKTVNIPFIAPQAGTGTATGSFKSLGDPFKLKSAVINCCSAATSNLAIGLCDPVPCDVTVTGKDASGGTVFRKTARLEPSVAGLAGLLEGLVPKQTIDLPTDALVQEIEILAMSIIRNKRDTNEKRELFGLGDLFAQAATALEFVFGALPVPP